MTDYRPLTVLKTAEKPNMCSHCEVEMRWGNLQDETQA